MKRMAIALGVMLGLAVAGTGAAPAPHAAAPGPRARQLLALINAARANPRYRAETGGAAAPLKWDAAVAAVSQRHAEAMARTGRLSHLDAQGESPGTRLEKAGVDWTITGENIGMAPAVAEVQSLMMAEPPFRHNHRANILDRRFTAVGIGVVAVGNEYWVTEDFVRLDSSAPAAKHDRHEVMRH